MLICRASWAVWATEGRAFTRPSQAARREPSAAAHASLERHDWDAYGHWFLGLTDGARDQTKARYAFVFGDFRRIHRMGLIACQYRAAEWRHKAVELAAHVLLQELDAASGLKR